MNQIRLFSIVTSLAVLIGFSGLSVTRASAADEDAAAKEKPPVKEEFSTDLKVLDAVGPTDDGQKVLHLHIEEDNWDGFLSGIGSKDYLAKFRPMWDFQGDRRVLEFTSHKDLSPHQRVMLGASGVFENDRIARDVRVVVTHRIIYTRGARKAAGDISQLADRWAYRANVLPCSLDLVSLSEGARYGDIFGRIPREGPVRFLEKLEILGVRQDGTVKVRYGPNEFVLPVDRVWPAPIRGRTVPVDEILEVTGWGRTEGLNEEEIRGNTRLIERTMGNQAGIRFSTAVNILNRGIVTLRVTPAEEGKP